MATSYGTSAKQPTSSTGGENSDDLRKKLMQEIRKKDEVSQEKRKEEKRRRKEWEKQDDSAVLDSFGQLNPDRPFQEHVGTLFSNYPEKLFDSFGKLSSFSRELNTERFWQVPEFVLIGYNGAGKSSVLELLVGHPLIGEPNLRPLQINFVNNVDCEHPKITIKWDEVTKIAEKVISAAELPLELSQRNKLSEIPIVLRYEFKYCWNATFIDTPGLKRNPKGKDEEMIENVINNLATQERILIFVEEAKQWDDVTAFKLAARFDSKYSRCIFLFSKLNFFLQSFVNRDEILNFIKGVPVRAKIFFFSLFSTITHRQSPSPAQFQANIEHSFRRDASVLEKLKYDPKQDNMIGPYVIRKHIIELVWKKYNDSIPELLKQIRSAKKEGKDALEAIQYQVKTLDKNKLRALASNYVSEFLRQLVELLDSRQSSLEGNPNTNGQTLDEEKAACGEWTDEFGNPIKFDPAEWKIPNYQTRLYGGQQLERLLAEFRIVAEHTALKAASDDDIAASLSKSSSLSSPVWTASDIVQQKCQRVFVPLLKQLFVRVIYVTKRLRDVVENIMDAYEARRAKRSINNKEDNLVLSMTDFIQFKWFVRDLFEDVVEETAKQCLENCLDELQCTKLVYWDTQGDVMKQALKGKKQAGKDLVNSLAKEAYRAQQKRITKNILLKSYDKFLVKLQKIVIGAIQGQVAVLPEDRIAEMFHLEETFARLKAKESSLQAILQSDTEQSFMDAAAKFRM